MLIRSLLSLCLGVLPLCTQALGIAEVPIPGGLGVSFGNAVSHNLLGAEIGSTDEPSGTVPHAALPANREFVFPDIEPGASLPWRYFPGVVLPRPLRGLEHHSFVMVDHQYRPLRVISEVAHKGCDEHFVWLQDILVKKYKVRGDPLISTDAPYQKALRITFSDRQIDVLCGPNLVIQYLNFSGVKQWAVAQHKRYQVFERNEEDNKKRRMVLDRRRSVQFANAFTLGDRYKLDGAFGVQFNQPFAKNSKQQFPVDIPFYAKLPNLPEAFAQGDIQLVISPQRYPIVIRGTFHDIEFEAVKNALRAKYGTPVKSTDRHVIHKVSTHHAILKRLAVDTIELAFIDTVAQAEQRSRLWGKESEGL